MEPPRTRWQKTGDIIAIIAAALAIGDFFIRFLEPGAQALVYQIYLCVFNLVLLVWLAYLLFSKRSRYAETGEYIHAVNHNIRDWMYTLYQRKKKKELRFDDFTRSADNNTVAILDHIANAFSQICGVRCSVCIKELQEGRKLKVTIRDSFSAHRNVANCEMHAIEDDTPCNLIYLNQGRFYECNNVVSQWKNHIFKSASFKTYGEPGVANFFSLRIVTRWTLKYKSCLVVPIKCSGYSPYAPGAGSGHFYGFLCIDANRPRVFDFDRMSVLSASFADALFLYIFGTQSILDDVTSS